MLYKREDCLRVRFSLALIRPHSIGLGAFATLLAILVLAVLACATEARGAQAEAQASGPPSPVSNTEKLIAEAHQLLHRIRGDHENVHDVEGNPSAIVAAQNVLHDSAAPILARLDSVSAPDLANLSAVWKMLYFETRSALEFYLACGSLSQDDRAEKANASVADGEKTIKLLKQIAAKNDPADAWILEDQKKEIVRWFQAAAEGIVFRATGDLRAKDAANAFWKGIDRDFQKRHPISRASHLLGVINGTIEPVPGPGGGEPPPVWPRVVGVGFALIAVLFFMVLLMSSLGGRNISEQARPILVFFFALCCAMASAFIAGSLDIRGKLPLFGDNPIAVGAAGGLAVLILVILIGNRAWKHHEVGGIGLSKNIVDPGTQSTNLPNPLKEE